MKKCLPDFVNLEGIFFAVFAQSKNYPAFIQRTCSVYFVLIAQHLWIKWYYWGERHFEIRWVDQKSSSVSVKSKIQSSSRTGWYFFPTAGKSIQKEPPLKDKKLKTGCVTLKISKLLPLVVKQGSANWRILTLATPVFLKLSLLRRDNARAASNQKWSGWIQSSWFDSMTIEASAEAVKTPGRGFVLTRFLLPFHRMEKEEPVLLEDKRFR